MDFREDLVQLIIENNFKRIAEVGAWRGDLSKKIIATNPEVFYIVDPHKTEFNKMGEYEMTMGEKLHSQEELDAIADELAKLPATYLRMTSVEAAKLVPDGSLDLVFIDAVHLYEFCKDDINAWLPKVRKGGILSGDDYTSRFPGVIKAVDELLGETHHIGRTWYKFV